MYRIEEKEYSYFYRNFRSIFLKWRLGLDMPVTEKKYATRLITNGDDTQKDKMYAGNVGLRYSLNKKNILSVTYTYRDTDSNDAFSSYSENVISCGWQYNF